MKVLLYCPTYHYNDGELAIFPETLESIDNLEIPDGVKVKVEIGTDNPYPLTGDGAKDHQNTLHQYKKARLWALRGRYDALLTIEHDMIVPPDALVNLLDTKGDVIYGIYPLRRGLPILNIAVPVDDHWLGRSISSFPRIYEKAWKRKEFECVGYGLGCTLIHRNVLSDIDFRFNDKINHPAPDLVFSLDCVKAGFRQVARFDVKCGHIKADGVVLYPQPDGWNLKKYKAIKKSATYMVEIVTNFVACIGGRSVTCRSGDMIEMSIAEADNYSRAGYVKQICKATDATKDEPQVKMFTPKLSRIRTL